MQIEVGQVWRRKVGNGSVLVIAINPKSNLLWVIGAPPGADPRWSPQQLTDNYSLDVGWISPSSSDTTDSTDKVQ